MPGRVIVAGGSGFIGSALVRKLGDLGYEPLVLSRTAGPGRLAWDGRTVGDWASSLEGSAAVVNLSGKSISVRWTPENRKEILLSRVEPTRALAQAISQCSDPPAVWFNASAIGIYGDRGDEALDERSPIGPAGDFLVDTCREWEAAVPSSLGRTRVVIGRIGFVLGADGGALPVLVRLARLGLTSPAGSGRQQVSWIHLEDAASMIAWSLQAAVEGVLNVVGPNPCTNRELMAALARTVGRPMLPAAPAPVLRLFGQLSGTPSELVLRGQRVLPTKALEGGFRFVYPRLEEALRSLVKAC
ncbi:MAG: TIGR01777 family oxidoreductase [Fimbriimonadales bacterium]